MNVFSKCKRLQIEESGVILLIWSFSFHNFYAKSVQWFVRECGFEWENTHKTYHIVVSRYLHQILTKSSGLDQTSFFVECRLTMSKIDQVYLATPTPSSLKIGFCWNVDQEQAKVIKITKRTKCTSNIT